jgi:hypothetical protein
MSDHMPRIKAQDIRSSMGTWSDYCRGSRVVLTQRICIGGMLKLTHDKTD